MNKYLISVFETMGLKICKFEWGEGRVQLGPLDTAATNGRIVPTQGDYNDGETAVE
jgi:hypothetical protein